MRRGWSSGRPDQIELDVIIKNGLLLICELKSSIDKAGMHIFERKARFYESRHNRKADRLIVISPMIDPQAQILAGQLNIETYSDSVEVECLISWSTSAAGMTRVLVWLPDLGDALLKCGVLVKEAGGGRSTS